MNGSEIRAKLLGIEKVVAIAQHCGITCDSPTEEIDNFFYQMAEVSHYGMAAGILSGFIYYADTSRFYDNNAKMIEAAFQWEIDFRFGSSCLGGDSEDRGIQAKGGLGFCGNRSRTI